MKTDAQRNYLFNHPVAGRSVLHVWEVLNERLPQKQRTESLSGPSCFTELGSRPLRMKGIPKLKG